MTNHSSASFPDGLPKFRTEAEARAERSVSMLQVILRGAPRGMSDDQLTNEYKAQETLKAALAVMRGAIELVNDYSAVVSINPGAWSDFLHDEIIDEATWDERIREARAI